MWCVTTRPALPVSAGIDWHDVGALAEYVMLPVAYRMRASAAVPERHVWPERAKVLFLWLAALLALWLGVVHAESLSGKVVRVADGDTITVLDANNRQHQIRLSGIDAPEKGQAFGQVSKKHLSELVFGKTVMVETRATDRWGRTVGKVVMDGRDACLEQIRAGLAWHYKRFERDQPTGEAAAYAAAEVEARDTGRGLWRDRNPIPPWEFRHSKDPKYR